MERVQRLSWKSLHWKRKFHIISVCLPSTTLGLARLSVQKNQLSLAGESVSVLKTNKIVHFNVSCCASMTKWTTSCSSTVSSNQFDGEQRYQPQRNASVGTSTKHRRGWDHKLHYRKEGRVRVGEDSDFRSFCHTPHHHKLEGEDPGHESIRRESHGHWATIRNTHNPTQDTCQ